MCLVSDIGDEGPLKSNSSFVAKCVLDNESKLAFAACLVFIFFKETVKRN